MILFNRARPVHLQVCAWLAVLLVSGVLAGRARAVPVLDQEFDTTVGVGASGNVTPTASYFYAQTFTVGIAGLLDSVDLQLVKYADGNPSELIVELLRTDSSGAPYGAALATATIGDGSLPAGTVQFVDVDVGSAGIFLGVGDVLAIAAHTRSGNNFGWQREAIGGSTDFYPGGQTYLNGSPFMAPTDVGFRTYMDPDVTVADSGSTLGLMGLALAAVGLFRRR